MKKIGLKVLLILFLVFLLNINVKADADYSYRLKRDNRVTVNIGKIKGYVSCNVLFNVEGDYSQLKKPVENFTAEYKNETVYVTIKRSELNKLFQGNTYDNVYASFEISLDFLDVKKDKKYILLHQNDYRSAKGKDYTVNFMDKDYLFRNYNFIELDNAPASLIGIAGSDTQASYGGGTVLYELDEYPDLKEYPAKYDLEDIQIDTEPLISVTNFHSNVKIVEDVRMDLGETTKVIGTTKKENEKGELENEVITVDNFYGKYFENNKLEYSWSMFDKEGNPIEIKVDTSIVMDKSSHKKEIVSLFSDEFKDIGDRIKIVSFEHEGELNGKARVSLYVGDKFKPGSIVTMFYYNDKENELEIPDFDEEYNEFGDYENEKPRERVYYKVLVDKDGYISIELTHCSEYVLVPEDIAETAFLKAEVKETNEDTKKDSKNKILLIACISVALVLAFLIIIYFYIRNKKNIKE